MSPFSYSFHFYQAFFLLSPVETWATISTLLFILAKCESFRPLSYISNPPSPHLSFRSGRPVVPLRRESLAFSSLVTRTRLSPFGPPPLHFPSALEFSAFLLLHAFPLLWKVEPPPLMRSLKYYPPFPFIYRCFPPNLSSFIVVLLISAIYPTAPLCFHKGATSPSGAPNRVPPNSTSASFFQFHPFDHLPL